MNKVAANISTNRKGVFLQDELYKISQDYVMQTMPVPMGHKDAYVKRLIHK